MSKRITIKDLAKALDIHHSTVSRALRNDPKVKDETKKKIVKMARSFGYQVNRNALHLRGDTNNTIALVVPNIRHIYFTNIISYLTNIAYKNGFVVSVFESNEDYNQEQEIINTIIQYNFSGVIASIAKNTMDSKHFQLLSKYDIPLVFFDRVCEDIQTPKVLVDNYEAAFNATRLLIKKGYQRIAHVNGPVHLNVFRDRQSGYNDALIESKLDYQNHMVIKKQFTIEDGKAGLIHLLKQKEQPDAILSSSSLLSIGILLQAKKEGLIIPKNLALIGFGDNEMAEILEPGITSIIQPENEIASYAFELMLQILSKERGKDELIIKKVKARIIHRQSI